jgi:hypothetical protein
MPRDYGVEIHFNADASYRAAPSEAHFSIEVFARTAIDPRQSARLKLNVFFCHGQATISFDID